MNDKYSRAISVLKKQPEKIQAAWLDPYGDPAGCLFQFASTRSAFDESCAANCAIGCLTTIRKGWDRAQTQELTDQIRKDERIPKYNEDIKVEHLPVFAEWQRRLDEVLQRD